jgi:C1A family cysteine protease
MNEVRNYGWIKQSDDERDYKCTLSVETLPKLVDLRPTCPPVYDQGQLGSCTANGIGFAVQFEMMKQGINFMVTSTVNFFKRLFCKAKTLVASPIPSRLFIYYNERVIEGTVRQDSGANIRDGIKTLNKQGVCSESIWPYDIGKFKNKPTKNCYTAALQDKAVKYAAVNQDLNSMKSVIAARYPIVGGFTVYESFESNEVAKSGIVPMPKSNEQVLGGHCVALVGYDDSKRCFIVRNSWGESWGDKGYCYMLYDYWTNPNLANDFWQIDLISK